MQHVVARDLARVLGLVVEQRTDAGVGPHHVVRGDGGLEVVVGGGANVVDFLGRDLNPTGRGLELDIGGAQQRVILLVGDREQHAAVSGLEHVGVRVVEELGHHDVAALDEPDRVLRPGAACERAHLTDPWAAGVDDTPRRDGGALARLLIHKNRRPARAIRRKRDACGAGADLRSPGMGIAGIQHHQPRILHPAVRVLEAPAIAALQRAPARVAAEVDARARLQRAAPPRWS